ncbi:MAG: hypothetical protein NC543_12905 [bacterium]|nr:hypothetical protein [bacterium]MCM1374707.1 hypothetical protein [Muribaculum sp.]
MDKYEYKIKVDEIKTLIAQYEYQQAAEIADGIDWRRVKSVMMLCTISDLYKINRRYEDSRDILLLAYERHPGGRTIVYSLCELSIKLEDYVMAIEYYKEFVQIAPKDTGRYILQYKLYQAQDVSLEERIAVLEELKSKDYREKWAYELAYLYHRVGLATKCIEECDELILWFGEGKYVVKAMELKMLHQPLTAQQQDKYESHFQSEPVYDEYEQDAEYPDGQEDYQEAELQQETVETQEAVDEQEASMAIDVMHAPTIRIPSEEIEIQVKTMDVGQYNTINLQKELAEGLREVLEDEQPQDAITRSIIAPMTEEDAGGPYSEKTEDAGAESVTETGQVETEVFFGATGEIGDGALEDVAWEPQETLASAEVYTEEPSLEEAPAEEQPDAAAAEQEEVESTGEEEQADAVQEPIEEEDHTAAVVMEQLRMQNLGIEPPREMAGVLSMESDGQISLVVPESEKVEKQITGQMRIEDILAEWERMKRNNEEKRKEEIHQRVLRQTGPMFTAFEEAIRDGLLEQLEQGAELEGVDVQDEPSISDSVQEPGEGEAEFSEEEPVGEEPVEEEAYEEESVEEESVEEEAYEEESIEEESVEEEAYKEESIEEEPVEEEIFEEETEEEEAVEEEAYKEESVEEEPVEEEAYEEEPIEEEPVEEEIFEEETEEEETEEEETEEEEAVEEEAYEEESVEEEPVEEETLKEESAGEAPAEEETLKEQSAGQEFAKKEASEAVPRERAKVRALTKEEKELYGSFIQGRSSREKLVAAIDSISMAAYTGNVVITGDEGMDTLSLAKNMVREVQMTDSNFSGKIAKISGSSLNQRDVAQTLDGLANGALIIQKASNMNKDTVDMLYKALQREQYGLIVIMEDTRKAMNKFLGVYTQLAECFNARMDMEALSNDTLVAFGKKYANEKEYSIDELGVLALHTRIAEMQTSDHAVTVQDVKGIMDEAIRHANRKTMGHFVDILLAKRYDEEDMIILREKDFIY